MLRSFGLFFVAPVVAGSSAPRGGVWTGSFAQQETAISVDLLVPATCAKSVDQESPILVTDRAVGLPGCEVVLALPEDIEAKNSTGVFSTHYPPTAALLRLRLQKRRKHLWREVFVSGTSTSSSTKSASDFVELPVPDTIKLKILDAEDEDDSVELPKNRFVTLLNPPARPVTSSMLTQKFFEWKNSTSAVRIQEQAAPGKNASAVLMHAFFAHLAAQSAEAHHCFEHIVHTVGKTDDEKKLIVLAPRYPWCPKCLQKDKAFRTAAAKLAHKYLFATLDLLQHSAHIVPFYGTHFADCSSECPLLVCRRDEGLGYVRSISHNYKMTDHEMLAAAAAKVDDIADSKLEAEMEPVGRRSRLRSGWEEKIFSGDNFQSAPHRRRVVGC